MATLIVSGDTSQSAFNEEFGEHYSSLREGALSEKLAKHIMPARIFLQKHLDLWHTTYNVSKLDSYIDTESSNSDSSITQKKNMRHIWILDICFGLGYNALLSRIFASYDNVHIHIVSLEQDRHTLMLAKAIHMLDSHIIEHLRLGECVQILANPTKNSSVSLQIIWGDAKDQLAILAHHYEQNLDCMTSDFYGFDIVYHDPFSSSKNPSLWDREYFDLLFRITKSSCLITTYATKKNLIEIVQDVGFLTYRYRVDSMQLRHLKALLEDILKDQMPSGFISALQEKRLSFADSTEMSRSNNSILVDSALRKKYTIRSSSLFSKTPLCFMHNVSSA